MSQTPDDLGQKIRAAQERQRAAQPSPDDKGDAQGQSAAGAAMRVATDLVAALIVGTFIGYWIDEWTGLRPLFMVVFFFLGFAAGFLNIYRTQMGKEFEIGFKDTKPVDTNDDTAKKE